MLAISAFLATMGFAMKSKANIAQVKDSDFELSCRAQAKEIATKTYQTCMTENRSARLEEIRKEYQNQVKELKAKYELEINKLAGANKSKNAKTAAKPSPSKSVKSASKSNGKSAKPSVLAEKNPEMTVNMKPADDSPSLANEISEANITEDQKVIPLGPSSSDESVMDIPEPTPMAEESTI